MVCTQQPVCRLIVEFYINRNLVPAFHNTLKTYHLPLVSLFLILLFTYANNLVNSYNFEVA